jgi:NADH-quinone oxidoreductase subunit D
MYIEDRVPTEEGEELVLNMGPQHPSTHGVLRLELELDGEFLEGVRPHLGYLHRCFEKHAEEMSYRQVIPYTDRMDYLGAMSQEFGYALAVEKLAGIEPPPRVKYIRVIVNELQRIASHLLALGTFSLDLGSFTPFLYNFRDRERILDIFEELSGGRLLYNYIWIGSVARDISPDFPEKVKNFLDYFEDRIDEFDRILTFNRIFINRTADVGVIPEEEAIDYGVTGPNLRGSGVKWDLRKEEPYSLYDELNFDVPVGQGAYGELGSAWDRYWVRIQEMRESMNIIRQLIDNIPSGDIHEAMPTSLQPPEGEVYMRTETPRGDLGYYIVSDGSNNPFRVKARSPCLCSLSVLPKIAYGAMIADAVTTVGSLDIVMGEIDR